MSQREELFAVMRRKFTGGKVSTQKQFSEEISEERVQYYIDLFSEYADDKDYDSAHSA